MTGKSATLWKPRPAKIDLQHGDDDDDDDDDFVNAAILSNWPVVVILPVRCLVPVVHHSNLICHPSIAIRVTNNRLDSRYYLLLCNIVEIIRIVNINSITFLHLWGEVLSLWSVLLLLPSCHHDVCEYGFEWKPQFVFCPQTHHQDYNLIHQHDNCCETLAIKIRIIVQTASIKIIGF